jgi:tRNA (cytidine/uridine-2'-O-)-methyltransferase
MFDIVLYQPEIPPNTGNIMRLCANTGARLHLVEPLGFSLADKLLRRAGLDYREWVEVRRYPNLDDLLSELQPQRLYAFTTRARRLYTYARYQAGDLLLFGPETRGLPESVLTQLSQDALLRLPLRPGNRSLNLSNAVAVVVYEAWRQLDFAGGG